jgi:hypothetical protein
MSSRSLLPALAVIGLVVAGCDSGTTLNSSDPEPVATATPLEAWRGPATPTVFASGFEYPRGLEFGPDGYLYVAESGHAGTTATTPEQCTQVGAPFGPWHNGNTARISRVDRNGNVSTVAEGLPSGINGLGDVQGVSDVAFIGRKLYALVAGGGCSHGSASVPASVVRVERNGNWSVVADLSAYQAANPVANPSPGDFEPDGAWYSMIQSGIGLVAVEPNHGEMVRVNPWNGKVERIVDFSASLGHVVPTVVAERRGAFYVSQLGTFPDVAGSQKIWRVSRRGKISEVASGFTMVLGLEFDRCGRLYVLETSTLDGFPTPNTGRITRIDRRGNRDVIAEGLFFPTGMTFGPGGDLYVSNLGFGPPLPGEILRISVPHAHDRHDDLDMEHDQD